MHFLLHAIPGLGDHIRRQRDHRRLLDMPAYLLDDIGLTREQLIQAKGPYRF
jgi:uncharacterized protein YjiS (DUF1127 family)